VDFTRRHAGAMEEVVDLKTLGGQGLVEEPTS
jgi:hypothetical protein